MNDVASNAEEAALSKHMRTLLGSERSIHQAAVLQC